MMETPNETSGWEADYAAHCAEQEAAAQDRVASVKQEKDGVDTSSSWQQQYADYCAEKEATEFGTSLVRVINEKEDENAVAPDEQLVDGSGKPEAPQEGDSDSNNDNDISWQEQYAAHYAEKEAAVLSDTTSISANVEDEVTPMEPTVDSTAKAGASQGGDDGDEISWQQEYAAHCAAQETPELTSSSGLRTYDEEETIQTEKSDHGIVENTKVSPGDNDDTSWQQEYAAYCVEQEAQEPEPSTAKENVEPTSVGQIDHNSSGSPEAQSNDDNDDTSWQAGYAAHCAEQETEELSAPEQMCELPAEETWESQYAAYLAGQ